MSPAHIHRAVLEYCTDLVDEESAESPGRYEIVNSVFGSEGE
jgi:hypothetical protein